MDRLIDFLFFPAGPYENCRLEIYSEPPHLLARDVGCVGVAAKVGHGNKMQRRGVAWRGGVG